MFERLPHVVVDINDAGRIAASTELGAALLITHDCDLDKPVSSRDDRPRIRLLQFLPLRDLGLQDSQRQREARSREVQPAEPIYVGDVAGVGEAFGLLGETYYLPAAFFDPALQEFPEHPEAEAGSKHLVARRHGNRVGRLDEISLDLMRRKISVRYTRGDPGPARGLTY